MYILCERDFLLIGDFTTKKLIKQKKKKKGKTKKCGLTWDEIKSQAQIP